MELGAISEGYSEGYITAASAHAHLVKGFLRTRTNILASII